jgi:hypothetical protein
MVIRYDRLMVKTVAEVGALLTVPLLKLSKITCGAAGNHSGPCSSLTALAIP